MNATWSDPNTPGFIFTEVLIQLLDPVWRPIGSMGKYPIRHQVKLDTIMKISDFE
jgi:hypothetical protein